MNYLVILLFACHGFLKDGTQNILLNNYDPKTKFYQMYKAEEKIRSWAQSFPNAYIIGIFACCRQLWNPDAFKPMLSKEDTRFCSMEELRLKQFQDDCQTFQKQSNVFKKKLKAFQVNKSLTLHKRKSSIDFVLKRKTLIQQTTEKEDELARL